MKMPILIIGAGPVGMTMASELGRYDVPVRIIDKAAHRTDKSKALVIWSRTLELLDRGGGSAPFVDAGFKAEAVNIIAADKLVGRVNMESAQSPYPYGLKLPQSETERLLEERLASLSIQVERQVELMSFKSNADGVDAVLRYSDGREDAVSTDWLIGCDGAHSAVRHGLGATFTGETLNSDWMLADVHMTGIPSPTARSPCIGIGMALSSFFQSLQAAIESLRTCPPSAQRIRQHHRWNRSRRSSTDGGQAG
jgi:2-polyprenyl-6-methoxyphenol hydroxylase-like FAD-dependent oxidoreductase